MVIHTCVQAAVAFFIHGVRRHRDHRDVLKYRICPDFCCCRDPVHLRHLNIHEYNGIMPWAHGLKLFERGLAILGDINLETRRLQNAHRNHLIEFVVLSE